MSLHLAPNAPWIPLVVLVLGLLVLGAWAYRFSIPPLPRVARRLLPLLRGLALALLALLLAQPVLERTSVGTPTVAVLVDRSRSMELPVAPGGEPRQAAADRAVRDVSRALAGRARVVTLPFAQRLGSDSARAGNPGVTALGDALNELAETPLAEDATAVVVVSDGVSNAGADPVAAARRLGLPVHTLLAGTAQGVDRAALEVEAPSEAQAGRAVPVRVHVATREPAGAPIGVSLTADGRVLARVTVPSPGPGAEAVAELRATPVRPGLAVWTATVDSLPGEASVRNNARGVAFPVSPGRSGVTLVTSGLNWDFTFVRRALAADSSLELTTWVRDLSGWRRLEGGRAGTPGEDDLRRAAVLVLDAVAPRDVGPAFEAQVMRLLERGGGLLVLGGPPPGIGRLRGTRLGDLLGVELAPGVPARVATPSPVPGARDLLSWDDDPARGERAWREAAPIADPAPLASGAGDRVLVSAVGGGAPLLVVRRAARGQALLANGTGFWRWSLSGHDELAAERGRRLWRGLVRWLAEPVQAEPLRVRPERWLSASGEPVRLIATLQNEAFEPLGGAVVEGEITGPGVSRRVRFDAGPSGSYTASVEELPAGHYRLNARAMLRGRAAGAASTEFAVDRTSLEEVHALPDSATLAAVAAATGGRTGDAGNASFARSLGVRAGGRRSSSVRLWESPGIFAVVVGALGLEWAWRRRRGLP